MNPGEFEKSAKRAAVEAAERRWQQNVGVARDRRRRSFLSRIVVLLVCAVIVIVGLRMFGKHPGIKWPWCSESSSASDYEDVVRYNKHAAEHYARILCEFSHDNDLLPWRYAPKEIKPKHAAIGTAYYALIPRRDGGAWLYEAVVKSHNAVDYYMLSPHMSPIAVPAAEFNKAKENAQYFIMCGGKVYVCGKVTVEEGHALLMKTLGAFGIGEQN